MGWFHAKTHQLAPEKMFGRVQWGLTHFLTPKNIRIHQVPSGYVQIAIEKMTIEIVDFPIKHGDFL